MALTPEEVTRLLNLLEQAKELLKRSSKPSHVELESAIDKFIQDIEDAC